MEKNKRDRKIKNLQSRTEMKEKEQKNQTRTERSEKMKKNRQKRKTEKCRNKHNVGCKKTHVGYKYLEPVSIGECVFADNLVVFVKNRSELKYNLMGPLISSRCFFYKI